MEQSDSLPLIVGAKADALAPGSFEEHGPRDWARKVLYGKQDVQLDAMQDQLNAVQAKVDTLLSSIRQPSSSAFQLTGLEVGLAVTAEGSIGLATVGAEVSLTLVYSRDPK